MKYGKRAAAAFLVFASITSILARDRLSASQPGTSADPLVSKSYVDGRISEVLNQAGGGTAGAAVSGADMESIITDVVARMEFLYGDKLLEGNGLNYSDPVSQGDKYVPVSATFGQIILGDEGCEIILRSGGAIVYSNADNGLVDGTLGTELMHGDEIQKNHILIVPRGDGRGAAVTKNEAWFIIKGQFEILN